MYSYINDIEETDIVFQETNAYICLKQRSSSYSYFNQRFTLDLNLDSFNRKKLLKVIDGLITHDGNVTETVKISNKNKNKSYEFWILYHTLHISFFDEDIYTLRRDNYYVINEALILIFTEIKEFLIRKEAEEQPQQSNIFTRFGRYLRSFFCN